MLIEYPFPLSQLYEDALEHEREVWAEVEAEPQSSKRLRPVLRGEA
jgi:hypothetical protein